MVNSIKTGRREEYRLQITKPARTAHLVEEDSEGEATRLADVLVYSFDNLLVVIDQNQVSVKDRTELVTAAARDTESIYQGVPASVARAGNGYQVQLPGAQAAGFAEGDSAPVVPAQRAHALVIHNGTERRLAEDLTAIRTEQVSGNN